jgi:hypothetical protein
VAALSATKHNRDFDFVTFLEKPLDVTCLRLVVMFFNLDPEFNRLEFLIASTLAGFFFLLP